MARRSLGAWLARVLAVTTLLTLLLGVVGHFVPLKEGLMASYFPAADWTLTPAHTRVDPQPSTAALDRAWDSKPPVVFAATWHGALLVLAEDDYTFVVRCDDGAHLYVDGRLVVDNGGGHATQSRLATTHLSRGVHPIYLDYVQLGGGFQMDLLWRRGNGRMAVIPSWMFATRSSSLAAVLASRLLWRTLALVEWIWVFGLVGAVGLLLTRALSPIRRALVRDGAWPAFRWVLLGSLALNIPGVWWGLPGQWVPNEATPAFLLDGLARHFSHGWFDTYPPLHYYVLSLAMSPLLLLQALSRVELDGPAGYTAIMLTVRLVSVAAGAGILTCAYFCGAELFGRRAGLFAAALFALVTPFVYYAKCANVDVPYLFWAALSFVFYLRLLRLLRLRDFLLFAAAGTCSICTKDQAYGLYLFTPVPVIIELWRAHRQSGDAHPVLRAVLDRRLLAAGATMLVLFVVLQNLVFNFRGFIDHVRFIVGPGKDYSTFEPTLRGHVGLLVLTMQLIQESFGWPSTILALAGLAIAWLTPALRRPSIWILVPVVSYYLTFTNVLLYNYDRFVMPICFVFALFGGLAVDRAAVRARGRAMWRLALAGVAGYALLYSAPVDILMIGDSRYDVEKWLLARVGRSELVASAFASEYQPRLDRFSHTDINTIDDLERQQPAYYVLNADYARAERPDRPLGQVIAGLKDGSLGYRLVYRYRGSSLWRWLPGAHPDLLGPRLETEVFSTLRNIDPTIEVYQRKTISEAP